MRIYGCGQKCAKTHVLVVRIVRQRLVVDSREHFYMGNSRLGSRVLANNWLAQGFQYRLDFHLRTTPRPCFANFFCIQMTRIHLRKMSTLKKIITEFDCFSAYFFSIRIGDGILQELWHLSVLSPFSIIIDIVFVCFVEDFWSPVVNLFQIIQ